MIPQYYQEILIWVIQHYHNWGAPATGRDPWIVIRKEVFSRVKKILKLIFPRVILIV
jgi:hypothetical protein